MYLQFVRNISMKCLKIPRRGNHRETTPAQATFQRDT